MKAINELTIEEAQKELEEVEKRYHDLLKIFNKEVLHPTENSDEIDHGFCIVILDKGFIYIGDLTTDEKFLTIKDPKNIRYYSSGKGLLWHAANGSKDVKLDPYPNGIIKAPFFELKHFIPTEKSLWVQ